MDKINFWLEKSNGPSPERSKIQEGVFSITGIQPYPLNFSLEYPVLAICFKPIYIGITRKPGAYWSIPDNLANGSSIFVKNTSFLIADSNGKFRWVSVNRSKYFSPELAVIDPISDKHELPRYSMRKKGKEPEKMIYPVRPFSITGISLEGFDPVKDYPVLAIDIDQYIPDEKPEPEEQDNQDIQPASQSLAFFLVGNDTGEFAWIAEDECRLFPLNKTTG
jgi:hypothetical protein